jgi:hypothetical protein
MFLYFNSVSGSTFTPVTPPTIYEVNGTGLGAGMYYFDWTFATKNDLDIVFNVDGGSSIPTEEIRYIKDVISPKDGFLDEPISQVVTDVWSDTGAYAATQKGWLVDEIGTYGDPSATGSLFGQLVWVKEKVRGDTATLNDGNSDKDIYTRIGAPVGASISADMQSNTATLAGDITSGTSTITSSLNLIAGTGFVSASNSLVAITGLVSSLTPSDIAGAVWDALLSAHTVASSFGAAFGTMSQQLARVLGMLHENSVLDLTSFDTNNNLLAGRLRLYSTAADAVAAQAASPATYDTNKIAQYAITATYTGTNLTTYLVDRTA